MLTRNEQIGKRGVRPCHRGVRRNLRTWAEVVVCREGIFERTKFCLECLLETLEDTEFGLFIFGRDDLIRIRGTEMLVAREGFARWRFPRRCAPRRRLSANVGPQEPAMTITSMGARSTTSSNFWATTRTVSACRLGVRECTRLPVLEPETVISLHLR